MLHRTPFRLIQLALFASLIWIAAPASAQLQIDDGCMTEVAGFKANCTANDVRIASVQNLVINDDGCAFPGDTVNFTADFEVLLTAQARHDIGLWFSTDGDPNGDSSRTGQCTIATIPFEPDLPWLDLDGTNDTFPGTNVVSGIQDLCGDIDDDHNPLFPTITLDVACIDTDGDGQLNLPNCTSWRQPGANDLCLSPLDAFHGAPSKCRCDDGLNLPILLPPAIDIVKTFSSNADEDGSGSVTLNDTLTYSFLVTNTGFADLVNVTVTDPLPGLSPVSCPQDTLDVGTNMTCSATYVVMQADADAGQIANTAKATGEDALGEMVMDEDPELVPVEQNPELTLVKTADNPGDCTAAGALISYSYLVTNSGDVTIHQPITIDDDLTTDEACPGAPASLAPGDSITCSSSYTASQADVDAGSIHNNATANGFDPNGQSVVSNPDDETVICPQNPALTLVKTADDPNACTVVGATVSYSYDVTNSGNVTIHQPITIDDDLTTDEACPAAPASLAPGDSITCTSSYVVTQADIDAGSIHNNATAQGFDTNAQAVVSNEDNETVTCPQTPALTLVKTADDPGACTLVGATVNYSYDVTNSGNVTIHQPITIDDDLTTDEACPAAPASLAPGDSITCTSSYVVTQGDIDAGSITNNATASGLDTNSQTVTSNVDSETVTCPQDPAIDVQKTPDTQEVEVGGTATFTIVVTNIGNVTLDPVSVSDPESPDCDRADLGALAPGASTQYDCSATNVLAPFTNVATATGIDPNGDPVMDVDDAEVTVLANLCEPGKPKTLIVQYNGSGPDGDHHTQAGNEVIIDGDAMDQHPAYIEVTDHKGNLVFNESVPLFGTFEVDGVHQKISPRTLFRIFDTQGGTLLESVQFHTSCSQPLNAGDEFGSIRVVNATH